jgi:hypothetical protein
MRRVGFRGRGIAGGGHVDSIVVQRSSYSGDLAYMVCAYQATNSGVTVRGKNVLLLKRAGNKWLIVTRALIVRDKRLPEVLKTEEISWPNHPLSCNRRGGGG